MPVLPDPPDRAPAGVVTRAAVRAVFGIPDGGGQAHRRAAGGVLAAMAASIVLGGLHLLGTPAFAPPDETAHVAYALSLTDWVIPHITDFPAELPIPGMPEGLSAWTANHPPGPYALMALPLWAGIELGVPLAGFWAARGLNLLGAAAGVVLAARIAATVLPHRPRLVVGVAATTAMVPYFVHIAGTAYTDGLALAPTVALLAVAVEVLVRGPSRGRLIALVLLSAVTALVRAPAVVLVLLAGIAWGTAQLLHRDDAVTARLGRGVGGAVLIGLAAFAAAGWFYLGNIAIYGDPTGSQALFDLHNREPRDGSFWWRLTAPGTYSFQELQLWSKVEGLPDGADYTIPGAAMQVFHRATLGVLWIAAGLGIWHVSRTRLRGQLPQVAAWILLAVWWWALMAMMVQFTTGGGAPHARYMWPAFTGLALVLALGLDAVRLPFRSLAAAGRVPAWLDRLGDVPIGHLAALGALVWANERFYTQMLDLFGITAPDRDMAWATLHVFAGRLFPFPGLWATAAMTAYAVCIAAVAVALVRTPVRTPVAEADWSVDAVEPRQPTPLDEQPADADEGRPKAPLVE